MRRRGLRRQRLCHVRGWCQPRGVYLLRTAERRAAPVLRRATRHSPGAVRARASVDNEVAQVSARPRPRLLRPGCSGQPRPISHLSGTGHPHLAVFRHRHVPWTSPVASFFFVVATLAICFKLVVASALYAKRKEDAVRFAPTPPPTPATHPTTPLPLPRSYTLYPHRYASRSRCSRACSSVALWPST